MKNNRIVRQHRTKVLHEWGNKWHTKENARENTDDERNVASETEEKGREEVEWDIACEGIPRQRQPIFSRPVARLGPRPSLFAASATDWLGASRFHPVLSVSLQPGTLYHCTFFSFCANFTEINYAGREKGEDAYESTEGFQGTEGPSGEASAQKLASGISAGK